LTLVPSNDFLIHGHPGKPYDVNDVCAVPGCERPSVHAHHMWPRSFLRNQPQEWVQLPDDTVVGNRIGLCFEHHDDVSSPVGGHRARIVFSSGVFWWEERGPDAIDTPVMREEADPWIEVGPLDPQPPGAISREHANELVRRGDGHHLPPEGDETCPTCGRTKRKPKPAPTRKSRTWTLIVPDDVEIGADILDGWSDDLATILGFDDESSRLRRYHAVATGLAWVIQNRDQFVLDLMAAAR
jgi:hypothetical protein